MIRPMIERINKNHYQIMIIGNSDPRGSDNEIDVSVNEKDELIIKVGKANRCYSFKEIKETRGYIEVVAN